MRILLLILVGVLCFAAAPKTFQVEGMKLSDVQTVAKHSYPINPKPAANWFVELVN